MKVTVDANVFFSCLIKNGVSRRVWLNPSIMLLAPEFIMQEFKKYRPLLLEKHGGREEDFQRLAEKLLSIVEIVPSDNLKPFIPAAGSLIKDTKDVFYLACALYEDTIIWSNDKGFKKQSRILVKNTKEMIAEFGML